MNQDKISRLSDVGENVWDEDETGSKNVAPASKPSYGERWGEVRPTKMIVVGISVAVIILTMIVGFNWGGWVTGGTAQGLADDAVVQRLSAVCVGQFNQDPQKDQKLIELNDVSSYQRDNYVTEQGWATMPGEANPDSDVADGCAKLIVQSGK